MTSLNDEQVERAVLKTMGPQKTWQIIWNMKPLLGICLAFIVLLIIAIVIVLALIPVYLEKKDVTVYQPNPVSFLLIYGTNVVATTDLTAANVNDLVANLMKQLHLSEITINYATLISLSAANNGKKRQASEVNTTQCEVNIGTTGDQFIISFTIEYLDGCNFADCQQKYLAQVEYYIETLYNNITLSVTFTNDETQNIEMIFCLLNQTASNIATSTASSTSVTSAGTTIET